MIEQVNLCTGLPQIMFETIGTLGRLAKLFERLIQPLLQRDRLRIGLGTCGGPSRYELGRQCRVCCLIGSTLPLTIALTTSKFVPEARDLVGERTRATDSLVDLATALFPILLKLSDRFPEHALDLGMATLGPVEFATSRIEALLEVIPIGQNTGMLGAKTL